MQKPYHMKKVVLTLIALAVFTTTRAQVLVTSNFNTWTSIAPIYPVGWKGVRTNIAGDSIVQVASTLNSPYAVQLKNANATHKRFTTTTVNVTNGQNYQIKFWAKGTGLLRTGLYTGKVISTGFGYLYNAYDTVNTTTWTQYTRTIQADTTTSQAEFIFSLRNATPVPLGRVEIDSVEISVATNPTLSIYQIQYTTQPSGASNYANQTVNTGGIVTAKYANGYFLQSGGSGNWRGIHVVDNVNQPILGDSVTLTATVEEYFNYTQLKTVTNYQLKNSGNAVPAPVVLATGAVNTEEWEGVLVRVLNAKCTNASLAGNQWAVFDNVTDTTLVDDLMFNATRTVNQYYNVTGCVYYSFSEFKIEPRNAQDVQNTTGINETNAKINFSVYPNPASDDVRIRCYSVSKTEIQLFDITGKRISVGHSDLGNGEWKLNTSSLENGTYLIKVITELGSSVKSLVISH